MSDISVGKLSSDKSVKKSVKNEGKKYSSLKKEYKSFMKKSAKSDFANSPVLRQKEYEMLVNMRNAAEKEGLSDELSFIETRMAEIAESSPTELPSAYYPPVSSVSAGVSDKHDSAVKTRDKTGKTGSEDYNHDFSGVISAFKQNNIDDYEISYLLKKVDGYDDEIIPDITSSLELFAKAGVNPNFATQVLEELSFFDDKDMADKIDSDACKKFVDFKMSGVEDVPALKFTKFLSGNFEDENVIKNSLINMYKAEISPDAVINVLNTLTVKDSETNLKKVSPSAVKSIITLKKMLKRTRGNEKAERDNPINQLGVHRFKSGDKFIVMKNNEITYVSPTEGESIYNLKKEYNGMISGIEDGMLEEFASKYKNSAGEIDSKYLRTANVLRKAGIPYDKLFEMIDFCLEDGEIDTEKSDTICSLKKAGCLGADILDLMSSFKKTADGKYDKEDVQNACDLTSAVIGGKDVAALLPEVYGKKEVKDLITDFSPLFEKKSDLFKLLSLTETEDGSFDENAASILYNLAENLYNSEDTFNVEDFLKYANKIVHAAMNKGEIAANDEGTGICSVMCERGYTPDEILEGIEICRDKNGKIDRRLSDLVWQMSLKNADIGQITKLISSVCIDENNNVNHYMARKLTEYLENGYGVEKIMNFVLED